MFDKIPYKPLANHVQNTSLSSVQSLLLPAGANGVLLQATSQNVRIRIDGVAPTASVGFQIRAGDPVVLIPLWQNATIRAIEEAASAKLDYQAVMIF
jgi:hypothetical protein